MIVTVTPTIMSGTVVRWYPSEHAADAREEMLSASRDGVRIRGYLHAVPGYVLDAATAAYGALSRDSDADLSHLATHRKRGLFGPIEPVASPPEQPRCPAHGKASCVLCSQNPAGCARGGDGPWGCESYAETGMHWDTCPNRVRGRAAGGEIEIKVDGGTQLVTVLREEIRRRGGDVQTVLGGA